jgi:AcrR family transcriptional regulator
MPTTATISEGVPYAVAARVLLRDTLLDAACHQLRTHRWADITMAEVALLAGVSRQTLYNEFGSRDKFARALAMREVDRFLLAVEEAVDARRDDLAGALAAAFGVFMEAAIENPLVQGRGAEELFALFSTRGQSLADRVRERLTDAILAGWPLLAREDVESLSECLVCLAIGYTAPPKGTTGLSVPSPASMLGPYAEKLVAQTHSPPAG